jgi:hypothetical protein
MTAGGKKYALIIGNSQYADHNLARLQSPGSDVRALADVLRDDAIGGFHQVDEIIDQPVSEVRRAIARLYSRKEREDLLLLYFSGHGVVDDQGHLFLAVKDTERDFVRATAIPSSFISEEMDRSYSRRQLLILDCCHSGAFERGTKGTIGGSVGTGVAFQGSGYGRVVLTASDSTQYAWEGDRVLGNATNSLFTHFLIQGLKTGEADLDRDGWVKLDELYEYVYGEVVKTTPKQTPGKWSYKQQGDIHVAKSPVVAKPLPPELREVVDDPSMWVRLGAVTELENFIGSDPTANHALALETLTKLARDDSRRVSEAARKAIERYQQQVTTNQVPTARPLETGKQASPAMPQAAGIPARTVSPGSQAAPPATYRRLGIPLGGFLLVAMLAVACLVGLWTLTQTILNPSAAGQENTPIAAAGLPQNSPTATPGPTKTTYHTSTPPPGPTKTTYHTRTPRATNTPLPPTPTFRVIPTSSSGFVSYEFDDPAIKSFSTEPYTGEYGTGLAEISGGKLIWNFVAEKGVLTRRSVPNSYQNLVIETELKNTGPPTNQWAVIFRRSDDQYYYAYFQNNGEAGIKVKTSGGWESIASGGPYAAIRAVGWNRITVIVEGTTFTVYCNQQFLYQVTNDLLSNGATGLAMELDQGTTSTLEVEYFTINVLP